MLLVVLRISQTYLYSTDDDECCHFMIDNSLFSSSFFQRRKKHFFHLLWHIFLWLRWRRTIHTLMNAFSTDFFRPSIDIIKSTFSFSLIYIFSWLSRHRPLQMFINTCSTVFFSLVLLHKEKFFFLIQVNCYD
jgi:hypothetical protein